MVTYLSHPSKLIEILRRFGPGWVAFRTVYALERKLGFQRRKFSPFGWDEKPLATWLKPGIPATPVEYLAYRQQTSPRFFFRGDEQTPYRSLLEKLIAAHKPGLLAEVDDIQQGIFNFFSGCQYQVGFPPDWHTHVLTGQQLSLQHHWTDLHEFTAGSDIKFIWELSRFSFVFLLVRTYWLTGDDRCPQIFWRLVEDWLEQNPPQLGPNWMCGQEATFRVMAWIFGLYGFGVSVHSTPERQARLISSLAFHAERIEGNLAYARSQRNNHALSEGIGLWTIGLLFPEFKRAEHWQQLGWRIVDEAITQQIYEDGAYIQHSFNYARLALDDCIWALRLAELNRWPVADRLKSKVANLVNFLYQLQDDDAGALPNYGANDGALILPLSICDYQDFRPSLGAGYYLVNGAPLYPEGPWSEYLLWVFGPEAWSAPRHTQSKKSLASPAGGYYTLRGHGAWAFTRCATYKDRPNQADMLHFDFWYQGRNLICDAGTYLYNGPFPWRNGLAGTTVHNTVLVDGQSQMEPGPRFLWYAWTRSRLNYRRLSPGQTLEYFEGEHYGYQRLAYPVTHRRAILRASDTIWLIIDDLLAADNQAHTYDLHWLLAEPDYLVKADARQIIFNHGRPPLAARLLLSPPSEGELSVVKPADKNQIDGWRSVYYGRLEPATSVHLICQNVASQRYLTILAPAHGTVINYTGNEVAIQISSLSLTASLAPLNKGAIVPFARLLDHEHKIKEIISPT